MIGDDCTIDMEPRVCTWEETSTYDSIVALLVMAYELMVVTFCVNSLTNLTFPVIDGHSAMPSARVGCLWFTLFRFLRMLCGNHGCSDRF